MNTQKRPALVASLLLFTTMTTTGIPEARGAESSERPRQTLASLSGEFKLTSRFWPTPGASPEVTTLSARRAVILGGRVLRIEVGSEAAGFEGTGLMGYDESKGRFWYIWTDTTTTGRAILDGSLNEHGLGTLAGETPTPVGYAPLRVEIRNEGAAEIHEYFGPGDDGKSHRWLELRYERGAE